MPGIYKANSQATTIAAKENDQTYESRILEFLSVAANIEYEQNHLYDRSDDRKTETAKNPPSHL